MKVLLLAGANSIHTVRLANGLAARGIVVHLASIHQNTYELDKSVHLHILKNSAPLGYFSGVFELKKLIKKIRPDLINAHYATGYGTLARLAGFKPTLLSIWGSDVYGFPRKSFLHRWLLKSNLKFATAIASTSNCMAYEMTKIYPHRQVFVTPFGVDEELFKPLPKTKLTNEIVVGTVKSLESLYGIDILIKAFAVVLIKLNKPSGLKLEISGDGNDLLSLQTLVRDLGIVDYVTFHGQVSHKEVPNMLNSMDIFCAFSRFESFGVAILEASSCEKPVIVSDADGPSEVTIDGVTGLVVPKDNIEAAADAMIKLIQDDELRKKMGKSGRQHVLENYTWDKSLDLIIKVYQKTLYI